MIAQQRKAGMVPGMFLLIYPGDSRIRRRWHDRKSLEFPFAIGPKSCFSRGKCFGIPSEFMLFKRAHSMRYKKEGVENFRYPHPQIGLKPFC